MEFETKTAGESTDCVSSWDFEGYYSNTDAIDKKLAEIRQLSQSLGLIPPEMDYRVHSYGVIYSIYADARILEEKSFEPVWYSDFEEA